MSYKHEADSMKPIYRNSTHLNTLNITSARGTLTVYWEVCGELNFRANFAFSS